MSMTQGSQDLCLEKLHLVETAPLVNVFPEEVQAWCWLGNIT